MKVPDDVRADIPLTSSLIYFDNGATCLTPRPVVEAMNEYYLDYRANIHRGVHRLSRKASDKFDEARETVAQLLGASFEEIIFVKNTTEALNFVAMGLQWKKGDKIVVTELEHHSNFLPFFNLQNKGVILDVIPCNTDGSLNMDVAAEKIQGARLVTVTQISNILGYSLPLQEISSLAQEEGALLCVDAAQSVGHQEVNVSDIGCNFLAFPGHKGIMGPTGIGVLYVDHDLFSEFDPTLYGGGIITDVSLDSYSLTPPPARYEAGTPNISGVIGLGAAVEYVQAIGFSRIEAQEQVLVKKTLSLFDEIPSLTWYGFPDNHSGVISFNISGMDPHEVAKILDESGNVMVRSGHHCAMPAIKKLGIEGAVRASYHCYNTLEEIDVMVDILKSLET
ncbi:MAG: cysteine desulfurase [Theionarchaea archaeon]|nr:cysteine desulfurase [Theionarchaea archaeon]